LIEGVNNYGRTGDHRPQGLFVAFGPGITAGHMSRTVSVMDFAPTFCALLGVEMMDVDGKLIAEIVR
jgi:predicted AlkP superfamily phosphohydrolase/phosphomutase